ncbi:MAG: hypothetical protein WBQ14_02155 [Gaiellaceae bacterium]
MKRIALLFGSALLAVLLAALGCVVAASADNSTTIGTGTTVTTASDPPSAVSIRVKPVTIHACPSRFATSTTVSGSITPAQTTPITVTLQSRSLKGGSWMEVDSTDATAGFKFTEVGKCSKHGLWLRAMVSTAASQTALMKVVGQVDLNPKPGNQNTVKLKSGSKVPIGVSPGGSGWGSSTIPGDVGSKVRYEVQRIGSKDWKAVQTASRGSGKKHTVSGCPGCGYISYYNAQFKVPKTPGTYYVRGHFKATSTTAETTTPAYKITVRR